MQAYQSPPCPYCGITWNPPGSQACANCRNTLPPPSPAYAPPGYGQPGYAPGPPGSAPQGSPYGAYPPAGYAPSGYPQGPGYAPYAQPAPPGYPGQGPDPAAARTTVQLFGRSVLLPISIPPAALRYQRAILYAVAGAILLGVVTLGVTPTLASRQIGAAQQALKSTASHQSRVDAAFFAFFSQSASNDPNAEKVALLRQAKAVADGLAIVRSDETALRTADQQLSWVQVVAPTSGAAIKAQRQRLALALAGLQQADQALTAGVNEGNVALPYVDALIDYTKMLAALNKKDLVGAAALYPDAQQKLETAMALDHAAGLPPAIAKQVSSFNDALNGTEALIQALQAKDAAGIKKANEAIAAANKAMASPAESVPADYESKTFGPMQKAYDSAMAALKR